MTESRIDKKSLNFIHSIKAIGGKGRGHHSTPAVYFVNRRAATCHFFECLISFLHKATTKIILMLGNFTNTNRRNCPKCSFFNSMTRQTRVKNKQESCIFIKYSRTKKSKYGCHLPFHPPIFCHPPSQN